MKNENGIFRAGTSGLVLAEPNKKSYPPEFQDKSRLTYYASQFNTIEINSSFYKIPRSKTYQNWADSVPADFKFTVKLWQGITHEKDSVNLEEHLEIFFDSIDALGEKKGCLLIQFPASSNLRQLEFRSLMESIKRIDRTESWRIAVEFRHPQWYNENICKMLDDYNASLVQHDMPKSATSRLNDRASFVYLRFHGEKGDYRGSYENEWLEEKARQSKKWLAEGKDVYVYFNNTIGAAAANLTTLKGLML